MKNALRILFFSAAIFGCGFMVGAVAMRTPKSGCAMCTAKCSCCTCKPKTPVKFLYYNPNAKACGCKDAK